VVENCGLRRAKSEDTEKLVGRRLNKRQNHCSTYLRIRVDKHKSF
jgi:hypothetical protein